MAGQQLANRLHLTAEEKHYIQSSFGNFSSTLTLSGVFSTNDGTLNDELITQLPIGTDNAVILRASYVSIIRMKVDPSTFHFSSIQNLLGGSETKQHFKYKTAHWQNLPITSITNNRSNTWWAIRLTLWVKYFQGSIGLSETALWALFLGRFLSFDSFHFITV